MNAKSIDMTTGPVGPQLYQLARPMMFGILAFMSINVVDTFFVAQLGVAPLAAMGFSVPLVFCMASLAIGLGAGVTSAVSRKLGAGRREEASQLIVDGLILALLVSLVVTVIGLLFMDQLFVLLGAEGETLELIGDYMVPWFIGSPLIILPMVLTAVMRAAGNSSLAGRVMVMSSLFNLILDPLLIFGLLGFPRLELMGAAIASIIARLLTMMMMFRALRDLLSGMGRLNSFDGMLKSWKELLRVGLPAVGTNLIIPVSSLVVVYLVAQYGEKAVAGMGVASRVEPIALVVFYALSSIVGPFCGHNLGAGNFNRIEQALSAILRFGIVSGLVLAVVFWFFGYWIAGWFTEDQAALAVAVSYLSIVPFSYGCYGLVMCLNAGFNGIGVPIPGMVISFLRVIGLYLPLALVLQLVAGYSGLFIATALVNVVVATIGWYWFKRRLNDFKQQSATSNEA